MSQKIFEGYKFEVWEEERDEEFVWVRDIESDTHLVGNIGPLLPEEYPGLDSKENADEACIQIIKDIIKYSIRHANKHCGFFHPTPDGFPWEEYCPEVAFADKSAVLWAEDFTMYREEIEDKNPETLASSFFKYLHELTGKAYYFTVVHDIEMPDLYGTCSYVETNEQLLLWNEYHIRINPSHKNEAYFTLAHELGHVLLFELRDSMTSQ